ncbi:unnamed protein product [Closterium sp. Naga37s-1]|nr:unnamed protein product [Closterium sp. Naga37s-1]
MTSLRAAPHPTMAAALPSQQLASSLTSHAHLASVAATSRATLRAVAQPPLRSSLFATSTSTAFAESSGLLGCTVGSIARRAARRAGPSGRVVVRAAVFDQLSSSLEQAWTKLRAQAAGPAAPPSPLLLLPSPATIADKLTRDNIKEPMRDIRRALLEADSPFRNSPVNRTPFLVLQVSLPVVRRFVREVTERAVGVDVIRGVRPDQQLVKVVNDQLVALMGGNVAEIAYAPEGKGPTVVLMAGLQGVGKTTACGKLALFLKKKVREGGRGGWGRPRAGAWRSDAKGVRRGFVHPCVHALMRACASLHGLTPPCPAPLPLSPPSPPRPLAVGSAQGKASMLVATDVYRPAAIEQLQTLGAQVSSCRRWARRAIAGPLTKLPFSPLHLALPFSPLHLVLPFSPLHLVLPFSPLHLVLPFSPLHLVLPFSPLHLVLPFSLATQRSHMPPACMRVGGARWQVGVPVYAEGTDARPVDIARQGMAAAKKAGVDVVIVDTAGRLQVSVPPCIVPPCIVPHCIVPPCIVPPCIVPHCIPHYRSMMEELRGIKAAVNPTEVLLVVDAMTGQEAASLVAAFNAEVSITGAILTKVDGDSRGGAALSVKEVSGRPIKFVGEGETMSALEPFYPDRMASRILGMGDVLSLVEKAQELVSAPCSHMLLRGSGQ